MNDINRLVIIGGNHHNTLSVIRTFGKKKISFKLLIHDINDNSNNLMIAHSKYSKDMDIVKNDEHEILYWLINNKNDSFKQVIIPCSDLAEFVIDNNYEKLCKYYFIPGFKDRPGLVCKYMNKFEQKKWADENDIPMAKSWLINSNNKNSILKQIVFPCIVKPNISAMGQKGDITICNTVEELNDCLTTKYSLYKEILIQQFINKKYELLSMGYISDYGYGASGIERKIRETIPQGGGSTSLGQFVDDETIICKSNKILQKLYKDGYRGLFDIEFFECDDEIYLNEINFRHSGSGFALISNGIDAPYLYYLDCLNVKYDNSFKLKHQRGYFFCDIGEYNLYKKYKSISILQLIKDFIISYTHSIINLNDLSVFMFYIRNTKF